MTSNDDSRTTSFEEDSDGDFDVLRSAVQIQDLALKIDHKLSTTISNVGQQIWKGSLLMADYLIQVHSTLYI